MTLHECGDNLEQTLKHLEPTHSTAAAPHDRIASKGGCRTYPLMRRGR
jgi:hypothetical protein